MRKFRPFLREQNCIVDPHRNVSQLPDCLSSRELCKLCRFVFYNPAHSRSSLISAAETP